MTITPWYEFTKTKGSYPHARDIFLHGNRLIGTWYCLDLEKRSVLWDINDKLNASDKIIGVYENFIVATKYIQDLFSRNEGFYRIDLREGELLWDDIWEKPGFWIFRSIDLASPVELSGKYARLSDNTVVDVSTGYRVDITKEEFLGAEKPLNEELTNNFEVYINDYLLEFPESSNSGKGWVGSWRYEGKQYSPQQAAIGDDPIVRWRYLSREDETQRYIAGAQVAGTFSSIYLYKASKGDPLLFLVNDSKGMVAMIFLAEDRISQHILNLDISYPTILFSNGYLVIAGLDSAESDLAKKSYKNYIYRIHY